MTIRPQNATRLAEVAAPGRREPDPFRDAFVAPIAARAIMAAVRLGVFDELAGPPATPGELGDRLGLHPRGAEALASALLALGYLEQDGGRLRPSEAAARLLVRSSPDSITTYIGELGTHSWEALGGLEEALRGGGLAGWHERDAHDRLWEPYIRGLWELSLGEHDDNAALVPVEEPRRVLDVAGGHGEFAMAMCRRHPEIRATVLDLPASVAVGRRIVEEQGYADRVEFLEGDAFEADLGSGWDVVSVFNFVHHLEADRVVELLARARRALRPGGAVVVGETERPEPGAPSDVGAMTGLLFFATSGARTWSADELTRWAGNAGLSEATVHRNERSPWRIVLVARAP
jgi:SAM-dependent methyltransferase